MGIISGLISLLGCNNKPENKPSDTDSTGKIEMINPKDLLFTIPTIENALPAFEDKTDSTNIAFHEDEWRQIEFISKDQKASINKEIAGIKNIYDTFSHKTDSFTAFKEMFVRESITKPLQISFSKVKTSLCGNNPIKGLGLYNNEGRVKNGFAFSNDGITYYGIAENNTVTTLCIYGAESEKDYKTATTKWAKFLKEENLYLVDWRAMGVFDEENVIKD
jgi:hypothetical protein